MRSFSSVSEHFKISPENQPETSASSCFARIGPRIFGSMGNLTPVSVPEKPACRLSVRQVSRLVSPPSCGRSLLVQAMGAMPRRIFMMAASDAETLLLPARGVIGRGLAHALARRSRRNPDIPPGIAGRPVIGIGIDHDDRGPVGRLRPLKRALQIGEGADTLGDGAHGFGM